MQVIILKYVQVLCITVFFSNNINCDKLLLHNEQEDQHLYRIGSCAAECLTEDDAPKSLESCYKLCSEDGALERTPMLEQNVKLSFHIKLICRDSTSLVVEVRVGNTPSPHYGVPNGITDQQNGISRNHQSIGGGGGGGKSMQKISADQKRISGKVRRSIDKSVPSANYRDAVRAKNNSTRFVYLIKVQESGSELGDRIVYMSNSSVLKIENLFPNKRYNITATVLSSNREYIYVKKQQQFRTLPRDYTPGMITNIDVLNYQTSRENDSLLDAVIAWRPAVDMTCHYEILHYVSDAPDYQLKPIDVQQPQELYRYTIHSLKLSSEYVIAVRAKNTKNPARESELQWHTFHTPSCIDWHNSSAICAPENVANVRAEAVHLAGDNYQFNISWDKPRFVPDYYVVKLYDLNLAHLDDLEAEASSDTRNVSGDSTNLLIDTFPMGGLQYEVTVIAYANNRESKPTILMKPLFVRRVSTDHWNGGRLAVIILTPILMIGLIKISISLVCRRRAKLKRYEQRCEYFKELEQKAPVDPSSEFEIKVKSILQPITFPGDLIAPIEDDMEISMDQIELLDILGEGAFGLVRKGILIRPLETYQQVAVKMLKECPSLEDIKEFRREIEVMKSVGVHPNVVCLVGHYTKNINEMMLLTEYCGNGNLLNYLRCEWHKLLRVRDRKSPTDKFESLPSDTSQKCQSPGINNNKKPENVFNFDTSFANEKKSLAYKNLSDQESDSIKLKIIENKLYPLVNTISDGMVPHLDSNLNNLEESLTNGCTNACKCKVEIIGTSSDAKQSLCSKAMHCNIKVTGCECNDVNALDESQQSMAPPPLPPLANLVENQCYYSTHCNEKQRQLDDAIITSCELLEFARQVAVGMEFLAKNRVVHRDLAARNVLVCSNRIVKISDFGLSRDIYQENLYRKTGTGKLPIKWLALESLTHQVYTSQSDVWSFGVLLYEICTLGGNPYPLLSTSNLIAKLKSGYRMEQPSSCADELYALMLSCWSAMPIERPTFSCLQVRLQELLEPNEQSNKPVINLDAIIDLQSTKLTSNDSSYLRPVEY
uniref:receptor protein-tyrosine kinase n=1 Tax=Culex pipiens TaxID=7175 RepID=A0A8D8GWH5_CULPI